MLLLISLAGCKTKKSHVVKSSHDSSYVNHGIRSVDIAAVSSRGINGKSRIVTDWKNLIRLTGFTGTITPDGKVEGQADSADIQQSGNKDEKSDQRISESDSTNFSESSETTEEGEVKNESLDKGNQTEGFDIPWYAWLFAIGGIILAISLFKK